MDDITASTYLNNYGSNAHLEPHSLGGFDQGAREFQLMDHPVETCGGVVFQHGTSVQSFEPTLLDLVSEVIKIYILISKT